MKRIMMLLSVALLAGCHEDDATSTVTASTGANLSGLVFSAGVLSPTFHADSTLYAATAGYLGRSITVTPTLLDSAATVSVNGIPTPSGTASAAISLNEGGNIITVTVTNGTATKSYIIFALRQTVGTFAQQAYAKASNPEADDKFGSSVALSGDTLAVGAYQEDSSALGGESDNSADQSGAVYVFTRSGTTWTQQAFLKASNAEADDFFGTSVALSGDTLVVGAIGEASNGDELDNSADGAGAVYVFTRSGTAWTQQAYLKASSVVADDWFGYDVALSGDTLAVGARLEDSSASGGESDNSASSSGAAYVFE